MNKNEQLKNAGLEVIDLLAGKHHLSPEDCLQVLFALLKTLLTSSFALSEANSKKIVN